MNLRARKVIVGWVMENLGDSRLREHSLEFRDLEALLGQWSCGFVSGIMQDSIPVDLESTPGIITHAAENPTKHPHGISIS
jgi:hypothetical protein